MVLLLWFTVFFLSFVRTFSFDENLYFFLLFAVLFLPDLLDDRLFSLRLQLRAYAATLRAQLLGLLELLHGLVVVVRRFCAHGSVFFAVHVSSLLKPLLLPVVFQQYRQALARFYFLQQSHSFLTGFYARFALMHGARFSATALAARTAQLSLQPDLGLSALEGGLSATVASSIKKNGVHSAE